VTTPRPRRLPAALLFALAVLAAPAAAQTWLKSRPVGGNPGPAHNYVCPNADGKPALDCFNDAVRHLYTMCRHVKSIEIIEFGYEGSQQGVNGAKTEYCVSKQRQNMERVYEAALREAVVSPLAADMVRGLHEYWSRSLDRLRWNPGESDEAYKERTGGVYAGLEERTARIQSTMATVREEAAQKKAEREARKASLRGALGGKKAAP
jgi:hypothetical protein